MDTEKETEVGKEEGDGDIGEAGLGKTAEAVEAAATEAATEVLVVVEVGTVEGAGTVGPFCLSRVTVSFVKVSREKPFFSKCSLRPSNRS